MANAYSNGEKPLSKWTKADIFDTIEEHEIELKCSMEKFKKLPVKVLKVQIHLAILSRYVQNVTKKQKV